VQTLGEQGDDHIEGGQTVEKLRSAAPLGNS
jgi:hypothetical protein